MTIQEYLEFEISPQEKHGYYKGEVFAMSGAEVPHNIISGNLYFRLREKLAGKPCQPFNSDQRVHIPANTLFAYPDISIVCGDIETLENDQWNLLNPAVIIEVLSPSARDYDIGGKFDPYRDISAQKEYTLVDSQAVWVYAFRINRSNHWELEEYKNLADSLALKSIQVNIALADIYEGVHLPANG